MNINKDSLYINYVNILWLLLKHMSKNEKSIRMEFLVKEIVKELTSHFINKCCVLFCSVLSKLVTTQRNKKLLGEDEKKKYWPAIKKQIWE